MACRSKAALQRNVIRAELFVILAKPFNPRLNPMECLRVARALLLSTILLTASAQTPQPIPIETALPPFQFLQKPGPFPVGLRVVNQYDPSRKSPVLAGDHSKPAKSDKGRPLQTLIWYPALPSGIKSMKVGDYVALADNRDFFRRA